MSSLREDNRRLTQTVTGLRTDRRMQDRKLRDLQHQLDEAHAKLATTMFDGPMPQLPVEIAGPTTGAAAMAPEGGRVVGVADDGTEIVYEGDAASSRMTTLSSTVPAFDEEAPAPRRAQRAAALPLVEVPTTNERLEVTRRVPPISARAALRTKNRDHEPPTDRSGDASSAYRVAVELVKSGKHEDAVAALRTFVASYPRHDYADNAQYWLGEAFYAQKDYAHALTEFRKVIEVYPRGNKVPDALLKVGYCYQATGQGEKAHAVLQQVVSLYPKSEPATLATKRLETP
jgi:tol-pal system protein YbgF